jgi:hypothetical protein
LKLEAWMLRKLTRTGIATLVLAGAVAAGSGLPAQAQVKPRIAPGVEIVIYYYSNAQKTTLVGVYEYGCTYYEWGTFTSYTTTHEYACS